MSTARQLDDLRWHWGSVFDITCDAGVWRARWRYRSREPLTDSTGAGLRQQIRDAYGRTSRLRPVR